jgi:hypothetical protein
MKRFGWPRPAFLIGFVLASGMETYLYQAIQFDGIEFLLKPGVIIIGALTALSIFFAARHSIKAAKKEKENENTAGAEPKPTNLTPQIMFSAFVSLVFAYGLYDSFQRSFLGGVFPAVVCSFMLLLSLVILIKLVLNKVDDPVNYDNEVSEGYESDPSVTGLWHYVFWLCGLLVGCFLVGYVISIALFFITFLLVKARISITRTLTLTTCALAFLLTLAHFMVLDLPTGYLQEVASFTAL